MTRRRISRPELRLLIIHILNGVLQIAKHHIASLQTLSDTCGQSAPVREIPQRLKRAVGAEKRITAPTDHLEGLRDKFNIADTAASEFDIDPLPLMLQLPADGFRADHVVQRSKGRDGAEVNILPVNKRTDQGFDRGTLRLIGVRRREYRFRYDSSLQPGKALPIAALRIEVFLEHAA